MAGYGISTIPADGVLVYEIDTDPLSLDPARCADYIGLLICQALYEPLYVRDVQTGEWVLGAAKSCDADVDGVTYRFTLREDARWSDGQTVVADDYVFALQRLLDPELGSGAAVHFAPLLHADEISEGSLPPSELGVRALDAFTLEITLAYPIAYLEALLGIPAASPLPSHKRSDLAGLLTVSNGPFALVEHVPGDYVSLQAHPYHAGTKAPGAVQGIRFQINRDLQASLPAYEANEVQITCNTYFPFDQIERAKGYDDFYQEPSSVLFCLQFNQNRHQVFAERGLRAALHQAIDKEQIAEQLHGGLIPWHHFLPKGLVTEEWTPERVEVGDATVPATMDGCEGLTVLYADFFPNREVLEQVLAMWERTSGCRLQLEPVSFEEFTRRSRGEEYDICLQLLAPTYSEPLGCFLYYLPDLEEGADDRLIEQLERAVNEPGQRGSAYRTADQLLQEELPAVPLFSGYSLYFVKPALQGYRLFPDGSVCFRNMRWVQVAND